MKFILLAVLSCMVCGCLTTADQVRLNELTANQKDEIAKLVAERLAAYNLVEAHTTEVKAKIEAGTISLDDGKKYIELLRSELTATVEKVDAQIKDTKEAYSAEKERILDAGSSKLEYYLGLLVSAVMSFAGVNVYRSRKHPLTATIK